jgi:hypothetical protein
LHIAKHCSGSTKEVEIKHEIVVFPPSKLGKEGFLPRVVGFSLKEGSLPSHKIVDQGGSKRYCLITIRN